MGSLTNQPQQSTTGRKANGWRRYLLRLATLGSATLFALALSEVLLRLMVEPEAKRLATYDETLGWRGRPHGDSVYIRKIDGIRVPFHYNNLGFRDEDVAPKAIGRRRILVLGDSFVENLEVEYRQTFPAMLEQRVKQHADHWDVAVVGSQGYSTSQELLAFRKYRELISPDFVLLCFYCGNDFEDNLRRRFAYLDSAGELQIPQNQDPQWKHQLRWLQRWLYESSHVVFLVKNSIQSLVNVNFAPSSKSAADADEQYKRELTKKLLSKLSEEVRASNAEFGVVIIPPRDDLAAGDQQRPNFVRQLCADNGIAYLDLSPLLTVDSFFETDIHFNSEGHRIVAEAIDSFVADSFLGLNN